METTLVIPAYNSPDKLARCLDYLFLMNSEYIKTQAKNNLSIMVLDNSDDNSSSLENERISNSYGINYYSYTDKSKSFFVILHWAIGNKLIKTETFSVLDHEDIVMLPALFECASFLVENKDYSVAAGEYKICNYDKYRMSCFDYLPGKSLENESPIKRLWLHASSGFLAYSYLHAVNRTCTFEILLKNVMSVIEIEDTLGMEFAIDFSNIVLGKYKKLPINYKIRVQTFSESLYPSSIEKILDSSQNNNITYDKTFKNIYNTLVNITSDLGNVQYALKYILAVFLGTKLTNELLDIFERDKVDSYNFDIGESALLKNFSLPQWNTKKKYNNSSFNINGIESNSKIAIYGAGTLGEIIFMELTERSIGEVLCFIDMRALELKTFCSKEVITYDKINNYHVDYIIIANTDYYDKLKNNLLEQGIPQHKIISVEEPKSLFSYRDIEDFCF